MRVLFHRGQHGHARLLPPLLPLQQRAPLVVHLGENGHAGVQVRLGGKGIALLLHTEPKRLRRRVEQRVRLLPPVELHGNERGGQVRHRAVRLRMRAGALVRRKRRLKVAQRRRPARKLGRRNERNAALCRKGETRCEVPNGILARARRMPVVPFGAASSAARKAAVALVWRP